jgi:WD40 repeat protein
VKLGFSTDGELLATGTIDGTIQLWDWETGEEQSTLIAPASITAIHFSPDEQTLVVASSEGKVQVWNWQTQEEISTFDIPGLVLSLRFSPQRETLAIGLVDGTVQVWNWQTGEKEAEFRVPGQVISLGFSASGETLAVGLTNGTIQLWQWRSAQLPISFPIPFPAGSILRFSPDGQTLATASSSKSTVDLWDFRGNLLAQFKITDQVVDLTFSPDGQTLAASLQNGDVEIWKIESLNTLITEGCDWLQPYLESHPEARETVSCPR